MTTDEARTLVRERADDPPLVKWMDKNMRWHYGYLVGVPDRKRARIRGKDRLVPIADLSLYVKRGTASDE